MKPFNYDGLEKVKALIYNGYELAEICDKYGHSMHDDSAEFLKTHIQGKRMMIKHWILQRDACIRERRRRRVIAHKCTSVVEYAKLMDKKLGITRTDAQYEALKALEAEFDNQDAIIQQIYKDA